VPTVTLYTRPGCHLCEEARELLQRVCAELRETTGCELVERDIETDEALHRAYFERIPVVALDGRECFQFFVDEQRLRAELQTAARHASACRAGDRGTQGDHLQSGA
jgi:glutaredoxin